MFLIYPTLGGRIPPFNFYPDFERGMTIVDQKCVECRPTFEQVDNIIDRQIVKILGE